MFSKDLYLLGSRESIEINLDSFAGNNIMGLAVRNPGWVLILNEGQNLLEGTGQRNENAILILIVNFSAHLIPLISFKMRIRSRTLFTIACRWLRSFAQRLFFYRFTFSNRVIEGRIIVMMEKWTLTVSSPVHWAKGLYNSLVQMVRAFS